MYRHRHWQVFPYIGICVGGLQAVGLELGAGKLLWAATARDPLLKLMTFDRLLCDTWVRSSRPGEWLCLGAELSSTLITFYRKSLAIPLQRMQTSRWPENLNLSVDVYEVAKLK